MCAMVRTKAGPFLSMRFVCTYSDGKVGVAQELAAFLVEQRESFWFLEHPLCPAGGQRTRLDEYREGRLVQSRRVGLRFRRLPFSYLQSMLITFWVILRRRGSVSLFVGHSNVDCLAARMAAAGRSVRIVYVSIDFSPERFANGILNILFKAADRLAYRWATAVWHSYPDATELKPYADRYAEKCFETLHGNNYRRIRRKPLDERNRCGLVYLGSVTPAVQLERVMQSLATLHNAYPGIRLEVIGTSEDAGYLGRLRDLADRMGVGSRVAWHGLIDNAARFEEVMTGLGVALCLYEMTPERYSWYQLPGKVFAYGACGLPTVVSDRSGPVAVREIEKNEIGLVTSPDGLTECLARLFKDEALHRRLSDNAARWAAQFDWHAKFEKYLGMVEKMMGARGEGNPPRPR